MFPLLHFFFFLFFLFFFFFFFFFFLGGGGTGSNVSLEIVNLHICKSVVVLAAVFCDIFLLLNKYLVYTGECVCVCVFGGGRGRRSRHPATFLHAATGYISACIKVQTHDLRNICFFVN